MSFGFLVVMAGRRLIFNNDLSDYEVGSQLRSNSEKGNNPKVTLAEASVHSGLDPQRVSEETKFIGI